MCNPESFRVEESIARNLVSIGGILNKFKIYRDILEEPTFIKMLNDSDGESYGRIMKYFCQKDYERASQLILESSKSQKSHIDFKSLYFDSIIKSVCDEPKNLKLEALIGHSLTDILIRSKNANRTPFDEKSDSESKMISIVLVI